MRPRTAVAVWGLALALGGAAGLTVPDLLGRSTAAAPTTSSARSTADEPSASATTPTPSASASAGADPSPTPGPSPSISPASAPTKADLLSVSSFADASVPVVDQSPRRPDKAIDATSCVSDDVHATQTLRTVTGYDPVLEGDWTDESTGDSARQLVAVASSPEEAERSVTRLVISMQPCQQATPGHYVVGQASTQDYSPTRSSTWVGFYPGERNTAGEAPQHGDPCGGTLLARNGARFTSVVVSMCLDKPSLASLAETASERLG